MRRMSLDIRWLAPAAIIVAASPQCLAAKYMSLEQAQALIFAQAQEFVPAPITLTPGIVARIRATPSRMPATTTSASALPFLLKSLMPSSQITAFTPRA